MILNCYGRITYEKYNRNYRVHVVSCIRYVVRFRRRQTKIARLIYLSIALPYINYCNPIWSSASPSHFQLIISTQKRLIRIISRKRRDVRTTPLFHNLNLLKFVDVSKLCTLMFVYKSVNNLICSPISFQNRIQGPYNIRNLEPLVVPFVRSSMSRRFVHVRGANLWNDLSKEYILQVTQFHYYYKSCDKSVLNCYWLISCQFFRFLF